VELRHLRYFIAVAEAKSFSRAAKQLHISQPPLSAQIHALEEELGARLFDRSSRGASLTEVGRAFLIKARHLLLAAQDAKDVAKHPGYQKSEFQVGIITPALTEKVSNHLRAFRTAHPQVQVRLRHENVATLHLLLKAGEVDLAFTRPFHADPLLMERHLEWHDQLLAIPSGHEWAARKEVPWRLVTGARVLLIDPKFNPLYGQNFLHMCGRHGCVPKVDYAASDLHSLIWLASTGQGVCPYPSSLVHCAPPGVVFRPFKPASSRIELVAMWASKASSPLLRAFIDLFNESHPP
jgi:DNA-binding transcriptional LysR family regulator